MTVLVTDWSGGTPLVYGPVIVRTAEVVPALGGCYSTISSDPVTKSDG